MLSVLDSHLLNISPYEAFLCSETLQYSTTGFPCFFSLARAKQKQVTLQGFGMKQPACPSRL